jgi:hypothetical protein
LCLAYLVVVRIRFVCRVLLSILCWRCFDCSLLCSVISVSIQRRFQVFCSDHLMLLLLQATRFCPLLHFLLQALPFNSLDFCLLDTAPALISLAFSLLLLLVLFVFESLSFICLLLFDDFLHSFLLFINLVSDLVYVHSFDEDQREVDHG